MASKNIVAKGTTYNGVESVTFPVSGGGDATFYEISDTTAVAADVDSSKWFYTALGVLTQGTASGGGGGSTGLVYETGTWTPSEDVANYVILFANTHTTAPFYYMIADTSGSYSDATYTNNFLMYSNNHQLFGEATYPGSSGYSPNYGNVLARYRGTSASTFSGTQIQLQYPYTDNNSQSVNYSRYWATETGIRAYSNLDSRYWRAGRTYKWIAVWTPTT